MAHHIGNVIFVIFLSRQMAYRILTPIGPLGDGWTGSVADGVVPLVLIP